MLLAFLSLVIPLLAQAGFEENVPAAYERLRQGLAMDSRNGCAEAQAADSCANPAEQFCSSARNPGVRASEELRERVQELEWQAEKTGEVAKFLKSRKAKSCVDLDVTNYGKCASLRRKAIVGQVVTSEVRAQAKEGFERARLWVLDYLNSKLLPLVPAGEREKWDQAIARVSRVRLALPDEAEKGEDGLEAGNYIQGDRMFIGKSALLAGSSPDQLLFTFLHEFSHAPGLAYLFAQEGAMARVQSCLESSGSVRARRSDGECLSSAAKRFKRKHPAKASELAERARLIQDHPFMYWDTDSWPKGEKHTCRNSQHSECFADFLAIEIFSARKLAQAGSGASESVLHFMAGRCQAFDQEKKDGEPDSIEDPHPLERDRINRLIFAHPAVRRAIGCPPSRSAPVHCGKELR